MQGIDFFYFTLVEGFARGTQAIANAPFLLVEGMAQEISDTYE